MASNYDITMRQFNGIDYDTLYPKTKLSQIDGLDTKFGNYYTKTETSNLFLPKAGGTMGGILDMNGNRISNVANPTNDNDAVNKSYVDGLEESKWKLVSTLNISSISSGVYSQNFNIQNPDLFLGCSQIRIAGSANVGTVHKDSSAALLSSPFGVLVDSARGASVDVSNVNINCICPITTWKYYDYNAQNIIFYNYIFNGSSTSSGQDVSQGIKITWDSGMVGKSIYLSLYVR